ncbi:divergent polysaccharide deacteylase family protein [Aliiruegeria lutimaris]|uniref:Uncharacterized conserved protein YibQ, putative polysaccharide deacetylase 2 family n=1 Tax=Aliiruegeria lutimaris TaxID=571298 RepID=A0A1G8ZF48_9RHOB|nr:divergent polysaccharide deacetylase family protein [Aliiruegeria lutimaris]SDK13746.1 Uncharacterized conserved protein YibQ, putative polysaccharide deacetylase 2 family [Aliiruegeria lutimaris]
MGRGILSGLIWGSIISVVVLGAMSQLSPIDASRQMSKNEVETAETPADGEATPEGAEAVAETDAPAEEAAPGVAPLMQSPEAETTPEPAAEPPAAEAVASGEQKRPVTAVELPAGSEFRKAPAETDAELPEGAAAPAPVSAPAAPSRGGEDVVASLPQDAAPRPALPGMEVSAPNAPLAEPEAADTTAPAQGDAPEAAMGPSLPQLDSGEAAPEGNLVTGFPPPRRAEAVEAPAVLPSEGSGETIAEVETEAESVKAVGAPETQAAETAETAGSAPEVSSLAPEAPQSVQAASDAETMAAEPGAAETLAGAVEPDARQPATEAEETVAAAAQAPEVSTLAPATGGAFVSAVQQTPEPVAAAPAATQGAAATATEDAETAAPVVASDSPLAGGTFGDGSATTATAEQADPVAPQTVTGSQAPATEATGIATHVRPLTERVGVSSRLPQIGVSEDEGEEELALAETTESQDPTAERALTLGALARNARPFENPEGKPLFSVILIDEGDAGLDRSVLSTFSFPVTFAIDPTRPDARAAAEEFARAGFEVVALASGVPGGATPRDLETSLEAHLAQLPQAVALMDPEEGGIGGDRELVEQALMIAAQEGHGLIGWSRGLGPLEAAARKGDFPVGLVYRVLDAGGESSPTIRRYLDRAAFKAAQDGAVIMVGHSRPETVTALFSWALGGKAGQVALAPVSAVLRQQ